MHFASRDRRPGRLIAALGVFAAVPFLAGADAPPAAASITAQYTCTDGSALTVVFSQQPGQATLTLADGKTLTLPQALSADGGRYAKGDDEFWSVGNGATLTLSGKKTSCTAS